MPAIDLDRQKANKANFKKGDIGWSGISKALVKPQHGLLCAIVYI